MILQFEIQPIRQRQRSSGFGSGRLLLRMMMMTMTMMTNLDRGESFRTLHNTHPERIRLSGD